MTLNHEQRARLHETLVRRRVALLNELDDDAARVRALPFAVLTGETPDRGETALADAIVDTSQAELARDRGELREIETALERFETGRYGFCKECGVDIPFARLHATPSAARCAGCQARFEKTHRGGAGAKL